MSAIEDARAVLRELERETYLGDEPEVREALRALIAEHEEVWDHIGGVLQTPPRGLTGDEYRGEVIRLLVETDAPVRRQGPITNAQVEAAKWAIARVRFERAGLGPFSVTQADADRCDADARAALEAARDA